MTGRVTLFWITALILSALALVDVRNRYLLLFGREEHLIEQKDALHVEWGRLLLEQGTLAAHRRIDRIARRRLNMTMPDPRRIVLIYTQPSHTP
ncbi:cell division protein FtsL [Acidiferrobacter sp.]|jgi:cell division protein FtsL|uniref:cell division protein FtsL n=1 Tax=Acidiferrobacter sp. TaxID=1872107 RepID=UPI002611F384|nr:cell division protein FtsL [Acidiferrobacter sp.]